MLLILLWFVDLALHQLVTYWYPREILALWLLTLLVGQFLESFHIKFLQFNVSLQINTFMIFCLLFWEGFLIQKESGNFPKILFIGFLWRITLHYKAKVIFYGDQKKESPSRWLCLVSSANYIWTYSLVCHHHKFSQLYVSQGIKILIERGRNSGRRL